jgi:hypothetical protein
MNSRLVAAIAVVVLCGGVALFVLTPTSTAPAPTSRASSTEPAAPKRPVEAAPAPAAPTTVAPPPVSKPSTRPATPPVAVAPVPVTEAVATTGTLRITADVPDANVFIDRRFIGTAPVTAADLAPGPHRLNVSATGYDAVSEDIDVSVGTRDIAIALKDVRLSATLAVKHKHAMGSCTGTLRASPQGLTFETSNKDDAFVVPMAQIETFEVDYLAKNLKLKVKGGRTYNFTDPDGNADRLFVFHRDVDRVRKRS